MENCEKNVKTFARPFGAIIAAILKNEETQICGSSQKWLFTSFSGYAMIIKNKIKEMRW
ncbi:MAG: hypothetical protein HFH42_11815 [Lachnospiraceae bacterium]|nr:hypothetical protein [Lachnospiraceae bacterium]